MDQAPHAQLDQRAVGSLGAIALDGPACAGMRLVSGGAVCWRGSAPDPAPLPHHGTCPAGAGPKVLCFLLVVVA